MKYVQDYIDSKQREIARHPFFRELRPSASAEQALHFAPKLAFWIFGFQDILRMNVERIEDPELRALLERHQEDDAHDEWYLHDLSRLGDYAERRFPWLYAPHFKEVRSATYAIAAEVFRLDDDRLRLAYILVVESSSRAFFTHIARHVEESGLGEDLLYFSEHHLRVELEHELIDDALVRKTHEMMLPPALRDSAIAMIDRVYDNLHRLADALRARPYAAETELRA